MTTSEGKVEEFAVLSACLNVGPWVLRPLTLGDAPDLLRHFGRDDVTRYMDIDPLQTLDEAREIVDWATGLRNRGAGVRWSIRTNDGGDFVGTCGFNSIIREHGRRAEIAYDLYPDYWGRGIMREVVGRLLDFAVADLGLKRLEAMVTPGNERSARVLEACGFEREGLLKSYGYWRGAFWDQLIYGRVLGGKTEAQRL